MTAARMSPNTSMLAKAERALSRHQWFEAERLALKALELARVARAFDEMARIILPLQETRRQRMQVAAALGKVTIVKESVAEDTKISAGCYLVQPPAVGADARRLRLALLERDAPSLVLCREPKTSMGLCPIVSIGQVTIRTRIDPPKNWDKPSFSWYLAALEQLGDAAIASIDRGIEPVRQVDALLQCLDSHPDHEKLHQALADACKLAAREDRRIAELPPSRRRAAASALDQPSVDEDD
ncbi:MAG: hypothetical protein EXS10_06655 [Phycisphaerales bacterium]|nr:hypothetical protein [Phycisphaerales bacterium]